MSKAKRKPRPQPPKWYFADNDNCWNCKNRRNCNQCKHLKRQKNEEKRKMKRNLKGTIKMEIV